MSCKHDLNSVTYPNGFPPAKILLTTKTAREIDLEAKLEAAEAALAQERARRETRPALYWREKAEQAEADLKQNIATKCEHYDRMTRELDEAITAKEQAEASCAAMRLRFEKYVRENCKLIRHGVADGLGKPDDVEGKCGGYAQNGDEPHYICQECVAAYDPEDEYNENVIAAGSALLAELQRYREALEVLSKLGNGDSPGNSDGNRIAQAALEEKND